jgi:hypothetical protein
LQGDPIGFGGDATNLYRYCGNNPLTRSDPTGTLMGTIMSNPNIRKAEGGGGGRRSFGDIIDGITSAPTGGCYGFGFGPVPKGVDVTGYSGVTVAQAEFSYSMASYTTQQTFGGFAGFLNVAQSFGSNGGVSAPATDDPLTAVRGILSSGASPLNFAYQAISDTMGQPGDTSDTITPIILHADDLRIDTDGSGRSYNDPDQRPTTSYEQAYGVSLNADTDHYTVAPNGVAQGMGIRLGDPTFVFANGGVSGGFVGDYGPPDRGFGEVAISQAWNLGVPINYSPNGPKTYGTYPTTIVIIPSIPPRH